ncbi:MAG: iron ABC transporter permease [Zoogloeaceae bacterium]|jgi:iron complex transport system permease protein|nr:iron ABC transporter permease [Zoogloeaceae bacterium]
MERIESSRLEPGILGMPTHPATVLRRGATPLLALLLLFSLLAGLVIGRYAIAPTEILAILFTDDTHDPVARQVVEAVRLPRVLLAAVMGAGLAAAGAALQSLFRNPLAEPQLLGVSSGSAFGGVLAMLWIGDGLPVIVGALLFGFLALVAVFRLAGKQTGRSGGAVLLVLAGVVIGGVFTAGVSLVKLAADPQNQLPAIVFWLMGSLSGANMERLLFALPLVGVSLALLHGLRFQLLALALGSEDARTLGVKVGPARALTLAAVGLITAVSVAACGVIGWVGLIVPHLTRMACGGDHRHFLPRVMLAGAAYLVLVDTAARSLMATEIPLGVLTALLGAPIFALLVRRIGRGMEA